VAKAKLGEINLSSRDLQTGRFGQFGGAIGFLPSELRFASPEMAAGRS